MNVFIQLHRVKVSINDEPYFSPILVNIREIIAVEPTAHEGCHSEVFITNPQKQMVFHPLYCRESYKDILNLLEEKGVEIIHP